MSEQNIASHHRLTTFQREPIVWKNDCLDRDLETLALLLQVALTVRRQYPPLSQQRGPRLRTGESEFRNRAYRLLPRLDPDLSREEYTEASNKRSALVHGVWNTMRRMPEAVLFPHLGRKKPKALTRRQRALLARLRQYEKETT